MLKRLTSLAIPLALWGSAAESTRTGQLHVTVHDPSGAVISLAEIQLTTASNQKLSARADPRGEASFEDLSSGKTQLHVAAPGFAPLDAIINVKPGKNQLQPVLQISTKREEVSVGVDPREERTDPRGNSFVTTLTPAQIEQLPDDPDEMEKTLKEMAGPGAVMRVDGFTGGKLPHKSQIQSIRFRLSPYTAEEHDLGFALVDIITKPGLGIWHGSAGFAYGGDSLNARNFFAPTREPQQLRRVDLSLTGPLRRNRTSLSLSLNENSSYDSKTSVGELPEGSFSDLIRLPFDQLTLDARVQHALSRGHIARGEYQFFRQDRSNIGNFDLPERLYTNGQNLNVLRFSESGSISEKAVNEIRFQSQWLAADAHSASDAPTIQVLSAFNQGGAGLASQRRSREIELKDDLLFNKGKHAFRVGLQVDGASYDDRDRTNASGTFIFSSLAEFEAGRPLTYTRRAGGAPIFYNQYQFGFYVQDDVRLLKNLSLTAGVRYEFQTNLPDHLNAAPRAGFVWSPFKRSKSTIRGGAGIFHQWFGADIFEQTLRVNGSNQSDIVVTNPGFPDPFVGGSLLNALPPSIYTRDAAMKMPYVLRASLGAEQQIGRFMLRTDLRMQHGVHLLRTHNINAPLPGAGRPDPVAGNILQIESTANSSLRSWNIGFGPAPSPKMMSSRLFWFFNYSLSKSIDDTNGVLDPASNNFNLRADRGPGLNDTRHRVASLMNLSLWKGFQLGSFFHANSAPPYNITTGVDNNRDTMINDRPPGVGRNSARASALWDLDSKLSWTRGFGVARSETGQMNVRIIAISPDGGGGGVPDLPGGRAAGQQNPLVRLQIYAQAYNLFNHPNLMNFVGVETSPLFGRPTLALAGRRLELGLRVSF